MLNGGRRVIKANGSAAKGVALTLNVATSHSGSASLCSERVATRGHMSTPCLLCCFLAAQGVKPGRRVVLLKQGLHLHVPTQHISRLAQIKCFPPMNIC